MYLCQFAWHERTSNFYTSNTLSWFHQFSIRGPLAQFPWTNSWLMCMKVPTKTCGNPQPRCWRIWAWNHTVSHFSNQAPMNTWAPTSPCKPTSPTLEESPDRAIVSQLSAHRMIWTYSRTKPMHLLILELACSPSLGYTSTTLYSPLQVKQPWISSNQTSTQTIGTKGQRLASGLSFQLFV